MNTEKPVTKLLPCTTAPDFASPGKAQFSGHMPTRFIRRKEVCHLTGLSRRPCTC